MNQRRYACPNCLDEGWVHVMDPRYTRIGQYRLCLVPCSCMAGDRWARRRNKPDRARYDRHVMFAVDGGVTPAAIAEFREWLDDPQRLADASAAAVRRRDNYEPAFESFEVSYAF